ncbi:PPE domain-containing protein [Mycolicibacterium sphagni]|uniref:Secretion protein EspB n=1 Tax=Mycolicibacterium sphagni TaxID=1786 RepID=A0ABX2JY14_9MYCO|nr:secretion protein EspB [Mycolicibacterium sphagni]NTY60704.1 secretion protein EspB [Mycolicibacterium sphagni]
MTQTLNVEKDELLARAAELELALPTPPPDNPRAACALPMVVDAAAQLALSADAIRLYLRAGEREWRRLGQSLRNAAAAYQQVDEEGADAITDNTSVSARMLGGGCEDEDIMLPAAQPPSAAPEYPYYEVRQAATDIEAPDQGAALNAFAREWDTYQRTLQAIATRFRPFTQWDGDATMAVEVNFEAQRSWLYQMAQFCSTVAAQATTVAATQKWALVEHPSAYEVSEADKWFLIYSTDPSRRQYLYQVYEWYERMQKKSEEVLAEYIRRASLPLQPVNPKNPPVATRIEPPPEPEKPDPDNPDNPDDPDNPDNPENPDAPDIPGEDDTFDDDLPETPTTPSTGTPSVPSAGLPPGDTAALTEALKGLSADSAMGGVGSGMKAAAVGGGGGGGMPAMPLQPSVNAESALGGAPGAGRDGGAAGRIPNAGAAPGGGGMGMPMGAPGAGAGQGGDNKAKRAQGTEESLYSEDREWTEGVIGNRRRKDVSDGKESK